MHRSLTHGCGRRLWSVGRASRHSGNRCAVRTAATSEHHSFIKDSAHIDPPKRLDAFIRVLQRQGQELVAPTDRSGLHPWLIPITQQSAAPSTSSDGVITALLRWPDPSSYRSMPLPVVSMSRGACTVKLLARSIDEYLHRALAEEDHSSSTDHPLAAAAGSDVEDLYQTGEIHTYAGKFELYLIRKAGMFPDVCESLSNGHMSRGDVTSALVASEWYMRGNSFPSWGRPYEFAAEVYSSLDRGEEARDMARIALRNPWWTLASGYEAARSLAKLEGTPEQVRYQLSEEAAAAATAQYGKSVSVNPPKSSVETAMEASSKVLDMVAAGSTGSWDDVRSELVGIYKEAGLMDMSEFVAL